MLKSKAKCLSPAFLLLNQIGRKCRVEYGSNHSGRVLDHRASVFEQRSVRYVRNRSVLQLNKVDQQEKVLTKAEHDLNSN